ncbi:MAG: hypothetical protein V4554_07080 [Pseudomonadota bacterium]
MISDEDVIQFFQKKLDVPGVYGGAGSLQIGRGPLLLKGAPAGGCQRHKAVFNKFNVIPEYCFDCYKVLITPHTVMELFKLLMLFDGLVLPGNNTRKCMVEGRADSTGSYKGFIYCRSIEEGKEVRRIIKETVAIKISPTVPVSLKRGCSEFARAYPRYAQIKPGVPIMSFPPAWKMHEEFVDKAYASMQGADAGNPNVNIETKASYPPTEIFALQYWLQYAATIGDISYLKIAGRVLPPIPRLRRS